MGILQEELLKEISQSEGVGIALWPTGHNGVDSYKCINKGIESERPFTDEWYKYLGKNFFLVLC